MFLGASGCLLAVLLGLIARFLLVRRRLVTWDQGLCTPLSPSLSLDGVERFLREREEAEGKLKPKLASSVSWANGRAERAELVVIFLHGFSAGVREIEPVDQKIASMLGAHLLRYRLTGHGLSDTEAACYAIRDRISHAILLRDVCTAFALGKLCGKKVVLCGCSTGATLAVWLASQPWVGEELAALVLVSPAWAIAKVRA